jgi:2-C-methyl-D-erythritol 4-phosphate cytidylyltransferase
MVQWSVDAVRACAAVSAVVVAVPPGQEEELGGEEAAGNAGEPQLSVVAGGATRAESVVSALAVVETDLVAIHDAARPLVTPGLVEALVADLDASPDASGVIAATPVTDTIKRADSQSSAAFSIPEMKNAGLVVQGTEDRSRLWAAQTPQVFRTDALRAALAGNAEGQAAATDEAMLVEAAGGTVLIHPCGPENLKVTTPLDLRVAEMLLAER